MFSFSSGIQTDEWRQQDWTGIVLSMHSKNIKIYAL